MTHEEIIQTLRKIQDQLEAEDFSIDSEVGLHLLYEAIERFVWVTRRLEREAERRKELATGRPSGWWPAGLTYEEIIQVIHDALPLDPSPANGG